MNYYDQLHPWCVIRLLPNAQSIIVARFRHRNDADEHRRILRRLVPAGIFAIIFDPPSSNPSPDPAPLPARTAQPTKLRSSDLANREAT